MLPLDGRVAFDDETLAPSDDLDNADVSDPGRIVALLPTGGTTGRAQGCSAQQPERRLLRDRLDAAIDLNAGDRILIALPMFHVGGAFCASLPALGSGATMIVPTAGGFRNPDVVANFWRVIESQRVTHGALVPTGLGAVAAVPLGRRGSLLAALLRHRRARSVRRKSSGGSSSSGPAIACGRFTG